MCLGRLQLVCKAKRSRSLYLEGIFVSGGCISSLMPFFVAVLCIFVSLNLLPQTETTIESILSLFEFRVF